MHFGAVRVDAGLLTRGQVIALVNYMSQILIELVKLANLIITLTKAMASARRISDVMNISPEEMLSSEAKEDASSKTAERHFLEFDNVSMSYSGSRQNSIEDISFTADKGEIIGALTVKDTDSVMCITSQGTSIRVDADSISKQGRSSSGVKVVDISTPDYVVGIDRIAQSEEKDM